MLEKIGVKN